MLKSFCDKCGVDNPKFNYCYINKDGMMLVVDVCETCFDKDDIQKMPQERNERVELRIHHMYNTPGWITQ